jgi:hypothetical protein
MLDNFPWSLNQPFMHNIAPYIVIFLAFISPYLGINTLWNLSESNVKSSLHTSKSIGKISSIEYSGYRVNNKPKFKVHVEYSGVKTSIDALSEKVQFNLSIGDECVIYYNPNNIKDLYFDLEESINLKN